MVLSVATPFIPATKAQSTYSFYFVGPLNENNWSYLSGNVTVHAYQYIGVAFDSFQFNITYLWNSSYVPIYFTYEWNNTDTGVTQHHEYWLSSNDSTTWTGSGQEYRCFFSSPTDPTTYTIAFLDYTGLLKTYPYIKISDGGSYNTIEKRSTDAQNVMTANLLLGKTYDIWLSGTSDYYYGTLTTTSVTAIQLVLRDVDFSSAAAQKQLLLYQYVHAYAIRDFLNPTGSITVSYEDLTNKTNSVTITLTDTATNTNDFITTDYSNQLFSRTFPVNNATNYQITIAINHQTFGTFDFKQYTPGEHQKASSPFSLDFLGSTMGISTAILLPALLIIFVAGCFSELTSEVAAILTVIITIILWQLGWIEVSQATIITALSLSLLAGIVGMRKRMQYS
jgi:hypothetical protein